MRESAAPIIAHVVHRFDVGGMENGIVNLVNSLPAGFARHCVIALTEIAPAYARRIVGTDTRFVEMRKPPGQTARVLPRLWRELRRLRPAIVHTRNVATLEGQLAAWAAGVPARIHGEHGWDIGDLDGSNARMIFLRRALRPLVHQQVALSRATETYLRERVGVPPERLVNICNGVDTERFRPAAGAALMRKRIAPELANWPDDAFVVGTAGRIAPVKNLGCLLDAFARLRERSPDFARRGRLAIVGDGPDLPAIRTRVATLGLARVAWIAGARDDVPECLQRFQMLCVPSLAEGISNAILEAMASGLPVVATNVGGNPDLVIPGRTGELVASADPAAMAAGIETYFTDAARLVAHGRAARARAVTEFSLATMVSRYHQLYSAHFRRIGIEPDMPMPDAATSQPH